MSKIPPSITSAAAVRTSIQIPRHWSAEQALAVWEFLDDLARLVWDHYELPLFELLRPDLEDEVHAQPDLFDPDDDISF